MNKSSLPNNSIGIWKECVGF